MTSKPRVKRRRCDGDEHVALLCCVDLNMTPPWSLPSTHGHHFRGVNDEATQTQPPTINPASLRFVPPLELDESMIVGDAIDEDNPTTDGADYNADSSTQEYTPILLGPSEGIDDRLSILSHFPLALCHWRDSDSTAEAELLQVDMDDDHHDVYMLHCHESSWSRPLESESDSAAQDIIPHQALEMIAALRRAQFQADSVRLDAEMVKHEKGYQAKHDACDTDMRDTETMQRRQHPDGVDMKPRRGVSDRFPGKPMQHTCSKLPKDAILTVEYREAADAAQICAYPDCPEYAQLIKDDTYYLALRHDHTAKPKRFCLRCFEDLWEGIMSEESRYASDMVMSRLQSDSVRTESDFKLDDFNLAAQDIGTRTVLAKDSPIAYHLILDGASDEQESVTVSTPSQRTALASDHATKTPVSSRFTRTPLQISASSAHTIPDSPTASKLHNLLTPQSGRDSAKDSQDGTVPKTPSNKQARDVEPIEMRITRSSDTKQRLHQIRRRELIDVRPGFVSIDLGSLPTPSPSRTSASTILKLTISDTLHLRYKSGINTDILIHEVAKAETRLRYLYAQREKAISRLKPGSKIELRPKYARTCAPKVVSMDAFGTIYTELFTKPPKQKWSPRVWDAGDHIPSLNEASISTKLLRSPMKQRKKTALIRTKDLRGKVPPYNPPLLYCSCYGPNDGSLMISCANEKCLLGWYHAKCIVGEGARDEDGEWYCKLCSIASPDLDAGLSITQIDELLPAVYAGQTYQL